MSFLRRVRAPGYLKEWFGRQFNKAMNGPPWVKKERKGEEKIVVLQIINRD